MVWLLGYGCYERGIMVKLLKWWFRRKYKEQISNINKSYPNRFGSVSNVDFERLLKMFRMG